MKNYKIAFVGLGSIATRHLKNVHDYLQSRGDTCAIDLYRSGLGKPLSEEINSHINDSFPYSDPLPVDRQYDVVFVTNPTSMHYETILKFSNNTQSYFIEKPIFDSAQIDGFIFKAIEGITGYVACPLRYNPVLQYVKENFDLKSVYCARAISSSYLPDWRPGLDYRNTYSAHRNMGGGAAIDLIHEWDYLTWLFETPDTLYTIQTKSSRLEIDSDDVALYIARTKDTMIELHLDYFGRGAIRMLQLFMPDDTVECDILNGKISFLKAHQEISFDSERNSFQMKEIEHFFDIVDKKITNDSTPEHALRVLKIAKGEF